MSVVSSPVSPPLRLLTSTQWQWIGAGYLMTFSSMPGQTIFIAQFNAALRETFGLTHGEFGLIYTAATLASSVVLVFAGGLADKYAPKPLALVCLAGLSLMALAMSFVNSVFLLVPIIFGLRFFGQGMMGHIAMTTMSRWFFRFRGRALSFVQMGFPTGEALLPFIITLAIVSFGWRSVWVGSAAVLLLMIAPMVYFLLRDPPDGKKAKARGAVNPDGDTATIPVGAQWKRRKVLRDPLFYLLILAFIGPPAIGTLYIFHQAHLSELKGWEVTTFTALIPVLSLTSLSMAIFSGVLVDRFGAWRIVPFILIPEGFGCIALGLFDPIWVIVLFFITFGATSGMMSPVIGALWTEMYGTVHIGKIRALVGAAFVSASAIGPGISGVLIDANIELDQQSFGYAAYCFIAAAGCFMLRPFLAARVQALDDERALVTPA